ncbi:dienelactone hydrolase family protein [Chitinophaga cymbidii]|uniref:Carboxymethylenebutenolidase n=1 Tax=Chitinophaga cymbidii TaxID=1096750 RepID=A0A512RFN3_9BACT|nr:dienelactone hydrolase family protein [Chitinophaga cymbidii]GEP94458.1 carboxymethylenebutenolidase [Chitinophaga cymbidii]
MDQRIINLFDEYTHKPLKREDFLKQLVRLTGSMAAAMTVLPLLESSYANAATVQPLQEGLTEENITYPGDGTTMKGYLVRPQAAGKRGAVVVIHENRGLTPHIKDVTRRVAKAGYLALAPDALSPFGGTPVNEDEARGLFGQLDKAKNLHNFLNAFDYLKARSEYNGKAGCVGFCWGGALANQLAVHNADLKAAVPFYGTQPDAADVPKIKAALQLHYGEKDDRVNAGIPAYEAALKAAGIKYELYIYEGTQHAFHNDTSPARYNEAAAKLAWERTLRLFKETLS